MSLFCRKRALKGPASRRVPLSVESLETRLAPAAVNVLTYRNDLAGSGVNAAETQLTQANVQVGSFGRLYNAALGGQVYAQPLVDTGVSIANGPNTASGAAGVHNVAFVATENDSLYALDEVTGSILWQRSFLDLSNADNNTLGATTITPVPAADTGAADISPVVGITGTPVIDPSTNILYVVAKTKETVNGTAYDVQRLHAINISDGTDVVAPYLIGTTTAGNTNSTQIYIYGSGDGAVIDPYNGTGKRVVQFNALTENQRGALSLVNNLVYVDWASHGDNGPYHGWVVAWNIANLSTSGWQLAGVLNTTPNGSDGGIWQSSGRLAFEPDGSAFYFQTGNGTFDSTLTAAGLPVNGDYGDSLVKLVSDTTTSPTNQNINGWGFKVVDYFTPFDQNALNSADQDFGAGAPLLLPPSAVIPGHPDLLVCGGKEGKLYLVDRNNLGKYDPANDHVLNAVPDGSGHDTPPVLVTGLLSTPAYFNGKIYAVSGYSGAAVAFAINSDGTFSAASQTTINFGYLPGSPVISADATANGIVWLMDRNANLIHAYDAGTFATELWNSGQAAAGADSLGAAVKFAVPTVANGEVLVGTMTGLVAYGLTPPAGAAPNAPTNLTAVALSTSSISLAWQDSTAAPNTATGYDIEDSTDGTTFSQVTTAAAGTATISIGGLAPQTTYYFRIRGFNAQGHSGYSSVVSATTSNQQATQAPAAPSALGAQPASATSITLTWTNNAANQTGFHLDRATDSGFTQNLITENVPGGATTYTDAATGLAPGGTYYYRLRAFNSAGDSSNSNTATISIPLAPAKPSNVQVVTVTTTEIDLTWTDNAGRTASGYKILRQANNSGGFVQVANLPPLNAAAPSAYPTWADTSVMPGTEYEYHVIAYNVSGNNDFAGTNLTTLSLPPTGLTAAWASGGVHLSWKGPVAYGGVTYNVYRGTTSGGEGTTPIVTGLTTTIYTDVTATSAGSYFYEVTAVNTNASRQPPLPSESAPSNEAAVTFPPAAPTQLSGQPLAAASVGLTWTNNATNQTGFQLQRATDSGFTLNVVSQTLSAGAVSVTDSAAGLAPGGSYYYRIRALNAAGHSAFSKVATVTIPPRPPVPTNLHVTKVTATEIDLSWTDNAGPRATGYQILRRVDKTGALVVVANLPPRAVAAPSTYPTWADANLTPGTYYSYMVSASNIAGHAGSATTGATTLTLAPSNLTALAGNGKITLSWTAPAAFGAILYRVYRGTSPGGEGSTPLAGGLTGITFTDLTVTNGKTYYYKVTAVNANAARQPALPAQSMASNEASATPSPLGTGKLNFTSGFANSAGLLTFNGSAAINGSKAELTNGGKSEAGSFFSKTAQNVTAFTTQFTFQTTAGAATADGFTFCIQGNSPTALGPRGGGLGYGGSSGGIPNSIAIKFDLCDNSGEGNDATGLFVNGAAPNNVGSIDLSRTGIDLHDGDIFQVTMTYNGTTLVVLIKDTHTGATATQTYNVNIPSIIGSNSGFVGFTAGTGDLVSTQDILTWSYSSSS